MHPRPDSDAPLNPPFSSFGHPGRMLRAPYEMTADVARALMGVGADVPHDALTAAFRDAAKRAHPDVEGGDAVRFRQIVAAYRLLQRLPPPAASRINFPPSRPHPGPSVCRSPR